jgi:hypothetical protein
MTREDLQEVYQFIDEVPSNRIKKNLNRDFADGSYIAEVLRYYMPSQHKILVDVHNYVATGSYQVKIQNWNQINKKILSKLGEASIQISPTLIE